VTRAKKDRLGEAIAAAFWLYNAAEKLPDGRVVIVGRTSRDQQPPLDEHGRVIPKAARAR